MNVPFRMPSVELEDQFVKESKKAALIGLKGHRSVGGLRPLFTMLCQSKAQRHWLILCGIPAEKRLR